MPKAPTLTIGIEEEFQLIDPDIFRGTMSPRIQAFVDVLVLPDADANAVYLSGTMRVTGTLYVHVMRNNGRVTSVFQLDAESVEPAD